jgi:hypothetical protein
VDHDAIVNEVEKLVAEVEVDPSAMCLLWAVTTCGVLQKHGVRTVVQSGTMMWPRIRPEEDDGVCNTHFSYVWQADSPMTQQRVYAGLLPEMHIWTAIPEEPAIVDLTTQFHKLQCSRRAGLPWTAPDPPPYLWVGPDTLPENVIYRPDMGAIKLALFFAQRMKFNRKTRTA